MIHLKEVNRHNFFDVIGLEVAEHQKSFVASNVFFLGTGESVPGMRLFSYLLQRRTRRVYDVVPGSG
ncbi:hypothetical protein [Planococcus citreus]|uniref:hypothetical protein n=1 Tax=Planococcus citreus TaxID=1373 RepID=UPI001FC9C13B|nr:hypothetical protein [Planococcus citreus]